MRRALRAVAVRAWADTWPAVLLGLAAGAAVLFWGVSGDPRPGWERAHVPAATISTWPLFALAAVGAWAGQMIAGGPRGRLAYAMTRPISRTAWLLVRLGVLFGALAIAAGLLIGLSTSVWIHDAGPPLVFAVGAILACTLVGAFAGAIAEQENLAVGGILIAASLIYAPIQALLDFCAIALPRLSMGMGAWAWPIVLLTASTPLVPLVWVVRGLPARDTQRSTKAGLCGVALLAAAYATMWVPAAANAVRPTSGAVRAMSGQPGAPTVFYTTVGERGLEGVVVDRDGERVDLWGGGLDRAEILDARPSPDGRRVAMEVKVAPDATTTGPERVAHRLVVLDLTSDARWESSAVDQIGLGVWSADGRAFAFSMSGVGLAVVYPDQGRLVSIVSRAPDTIKGDAFLAWPHEGLLIARDRNAADAAAAGNREWEPSYTVARLRLSSGAVVQRSILAEGLRSPPAHNPGALAWSTPVDDASAALTILPLDDDGPQVDVVLATAGKRPVIGWLDARHVYVLSSTTSFYSQRLRIIARDGTLVRDLRLPNGLVAFELRGPPTGPWLALTRYGAIVHLTAEGTVQSTHQGRDVGNARVPWLPLRDEVGGVSFIGVRGHVEFVPKPWLEATR